MMMSMSKNDPVKVHAEALAEFDRIQEVMRTERLQCLQDRRFCSIPGAQWEGPLSEQYENRPRFEVNKTQLAVMRIINDYRSNRITVEYVPKEKEYENLAEACNGLFRATEVDSSAEEAYDNAFEEAVTGGFGALRLRNEYEDEYSGESDEQRICIEPIYDADSSVYFDLNAKRQDKADAKRCFVITALTREDYEAEWGDDPATWPKEINRTQFDWQTPDVVYVAEYYRVEETTDYMVTLEGFTGDEEKELLSVLKEGKMEEMEALGYKEVKRKKIKQKKVHKWIMSGGKVLEDCGYIAGKCIPIVPVYGKRWFVDNVERCMGHVRLAKDMQRLKNMQLSKLAEISALSSMEKPIFMPEQVAGHQVMWAEDNLKNYPYLLVNGITDAQGAVQPAPPIAYTKAPQVPPAMAALLGVTDIDMQQLLGSQGNGDKMVSHVTSKAVDLVMQRLDMQSYIYVSNMAKAIKRVGEIWLSMARDVFVEDKRKMKVVTSNGEQDEIELMTPVINPETGELEYDNDLSEAEFDVAVDVGPSSTTKRQATVQALLSMMAVTQDPETMNVLSSMAMMNMEGEGLGDVRSYFRKKLLRMGAVKPTEQEAQELLAEAQTAQPDAQTQYFAAEAQRANALATKAQADTVLTLARAEETRAKTEETIAKAGQIDQDKAMKLADRIEDDVQKLVAPVQTF
jgi:hypothetical protein